MRISIPQEKYADCCKICRSLADDMALLAGKAPSNNFFIEGLLLLQRELLSTADRMAQSVLLERRKGGYTMEEVQYLYFIEHLSGIVGIVLLYFQALRWELFHNITENLIDLLIRLIDLHPDPV